MKIIWNEINVVSSSFPIHYLSFCIAVDNYKFITAWITKRKTEKIENRDKRMIEKRRRKRGKTKQKKEKSSEIEIKKQRKEMKEQGKQR